MSILAYLYQFGIVLCKRSWSLGLENRKTNKPGQSDFHHGCVLSCFYTLCHQVCCVLQTGPINTKHFSYDTGKSHASILHFDVVYLSCGNYDETDLNLVRIYSSLPRLCPCHFLSSTSLFTIYDVHT